MSVKSPEIGMPLKFVVFFFDNTSVTFNTFSLPFKIKIPSFRKSTKNEKLGSEKFRSELRNPRATNDTFTKGLVDVIQR